MKQLQERQCVQCWENGKEVRTDIITEEYATRVYGRPIVIPNLTRERCPECGKEVFSWEEVMKIDKAVEQEKEKQTHDLR